MVGSSEEIFYELNRSAKIEVFHLEQFNTYIVEDEKVAFDAFKAGMYKQEDDKLMNEWSNQLKERLQKGVKFITLHIVDLPLSDYLKFEIETGYKPVAKIGQKILMLERKKSGILGELLKDFWIFDNNLVIEGNYTKDGKFLFFGPLISDKNIVDKYVHMKDTLASKAMLLEDFLRIEIQTKKKLKN